MNIALVTYALQIGGIETFLRNLADALMEKGHHVDFVETRSVGKWSEEFTSQGYCVKRVLPGPAQSQLRHCRNIAKALSCYDVVLLNDALYAQAALGLLSDSVVAIPILHHSDLQEMVLTAVANSTAWDAVAAVSPAAQQAALHSAEVSGRVHYIPNGVPLPEHRDDVFTKNIKSNTTEIVFIGALNHEQKGVMYLPPIIRRVCEDCPDAHFTIIGDGEDKEKLLMETSRIVQEGRVAFYGPLPNAKVLQTLSNAQILLLTSHFEGMPIVLLEAMSYGVVPVVSLLTGSTNMVVETKKNGFLIPVGDVNGFAYAIIDLAQNKELLWAMSQAARKRIEDDFSIERSADRYIQLIEECKQRKKSGITPKRTKKIETSLLEEFPFLPLILMRAVRKLFRIVGILPPPAVHPLTSKQR